MFAPAERQPGHEGTDDRGELGRSASPANANVNANRDTTTRRREPEPLDGVESHGTTSSPSGPANQEPGGQADRSLPTGAKIDRVPR